MHRDLAYFPGVGMRGWGRTTMYGCAVICCAKVIG